RKSGSPRPRRDSDRVKAVRRNHAAVVLVVVERPVVRSHKFLSESSDSLVVAVQPAARWGIQSGRFVSSGLASEYDVNQQFLREPAVKRAGHARARVQFDHGPTFYHKNRTSQI